MATVELAPARTGRRAELGLLILALIVGMSGYALVGLRMTDGLPLSFWRDGAGLAVATLILHCVIRKVAPYADPVILPVVTALNGIGLAMIYRISLSSSLATGLAGRQLLWTAVSVAAAIVVLVALRDHRTLRRYTYLALLVGIALLLLPMIPGIGIELNGARIWIRVAGFTFQPAELAKIAFAVFFAGYLVTNRDTLALAGPKVLGLQLPRLRDFAPLVLALFLSLGILIFQRDLGTSLLFFGLFVAMLYIATERLSWIIIGLVLFGAGAVGAVAYFPHVHARFVAWINPLDPTIYAARSGSGQMVRGWFGLANGGLLGTGWGQGYPQLVPLSWADFIIAALGEELGLTGLAAILMLYAVFISRGMRMAIGTRDGFGKLFAGGLSFALAWQLFVVVGGITGLIPITGLTTPWLAYGGSSLIANWIIVALFLRISNDARKPVAPPLPLPVQAPVPVLDSPATAVTA